jgi:DNA-directed RNA polymerase specialized sigma24 family protein
MDLEDDGGDFFQVRFWLGLKRLIVTEYASQVKAAGEDIEKLVFVDEQIEGEEGLQPMLELPGNCLSPEDTVILKAGLSSIQDPYRKVFILRYYVGWPIKSNDPDEVTLSSYFGVTPRTIQNWLDAAEKSLAKWRKEKKR